VHLVRFRDPDGAVRHGRREDDEVLARGRSYALGAVDLLAPCEPSKVVCVGLNYMDHIEEGNREVPERPSLFLKPPNAVRGPGDTIVLPRGKDRVEHECELGVVIGEQCRDVDPEDALDAIAGYTCVNDVSNRDDQRSERNWVRGKAFDSAAPIGPAIATPDEVPEDARIETRVDGDTRQQSTIDELLFDVPTLVAEITRYMTLEPGDVISTGTTSGVAPLADGNRVEIDVEGVGTLANPVRRDPSARG